MSSRPRRIRHAFTLMELLVAMAILAVLVGLLLPAVQKVREAAARVHCKNNLKQIVLAFHQTQTQYGVMPPGLGYYPGQNAYGQGTFHLLPFLEQNDLYQSSLQGGLLFAGFNGVAAKPIKVFLCPSDVSAGSGVVTDNSGRSWGACSYAGNAQVFAQVSADGVLLNTAGTPSLTSSFSDGTSNTLLMVEKYARCTNYSFPEGGNFWAYWLLGPTVQPLHSGFEGSWTAYSHGPGSKFQARPSPYLGNCDPTLASTPHGSGMTAAMADGSVRTLSPAMSGETWWSACTPAGGELLGNDWDL